MNEHMQDLPFCIWTNIWIRISIHFPANAILFLIEQNCLAVYRHLIFFICSSVDGYLNC